jgi:hypothetical protein
MHGIDIAGVIILNEAPDETEGSHTIPRTMISQRNDNFNSNNNGESSMNITVAMLLTAIATIPMTMNVQAVVMTISRMMIVTMRAIMVTYFWG